MGKLYSSGLIGLDMKPKRRMRVRQSRSVIVTRRWLVPLAGIVLLVSVLLLAGMR